MKILNKIFPEPKIETTVVKPPTDKESQTMYSVEDTKINEILKKHDIPLTDKNIEEVKVFLKETPGKLETKLETLDLTLDKGIELTADNLKAVHNALHSTTAIASEVIKELEVKEVTKELPKEEKAELKERVKNGELPEKVIKAFVTSQLKSLFEIEIEESIVATPKEGDEGSSKEIQMDSDMTEVQVDDDVVYEKETQELLTEDEKAIIDTLEMLSEHLDEVAEMILPEVQKELFNAPEPIRKFIQTEITTKMFELKETFETYQKSINNQLDQLIKEPVQPIAFKEILTSIIDKLDHIILKTDVPLYTDIKTERDLLASSGELELARNLVDTDEDRAFDIVKDVQKRVNQIKFTPQRQQMFGVAKKVIVEKMYEENLIKQIPIQIESMSHSPRAVLETLKAVGLNHEPELAENLRRDEKFKAPHNFKAILLKLEESTTQKVLAKDSLENLTGQQLLNKLEVNSHKQKMMLNIPVQVEGTVHNLKVHVDAKKENEKIDWKNSRLYFVIHLRKLGDTGVLVDVKNGAASITIKNDTDNIEKKMMRYVNEAKDRMTEVGFTNISVRFERLNKVVEKPILNKEGFDVSI